MGELNISVGGGQTDFLSYLVIYTCETPSQNLSLLHFYIYKISIYKNWTYSDIFYLYFLIYMYLEDTTSEMLFTTFWYFRYSFPKKPAKYIKCCFENM